jgi:glycerophosphoryl diester phosphodiesterase
MAAWELGAVPEADLRTTRDGVIVAFHDHTFDRVVNGVRSDLRERGVQDVTFRELCDLDVGTWRGDAFAGQRIRSVAEIFGLMQGHPDRALYMDIKDVQFSRLANLVREFEVAEQVILAAPDERLLRQWKNLVPVGHTLLWTGILRTGDEASLRRYLERLRNEEFAGITQLQIHIEATLNSGHWHFRPSLDLLRKAAGDLRSSGVLFQSLPWECADAAVYRALLEAGVQSFASDYPEVALSVLREWADSHPLGDTNPGMTASSSKVPPST